MKNALLALAFAAAPLYLTGCTKSCEDMEEEMRAIGMEMQELLLSGEIESGAGEKLEEKITALQEEYIDRCAPE